MSYCREEGKDKIIFQTKEDYENYSEPEKNKTDDKVEEDDEDEQAGLILPNGDINWSCPCLGGMATGPCGYEFREAFSCFHYSEAEPKGTDCLEQFAKMQECMSGYPELYDYGDDEQKEAANDPELVASDEQEKNKSESSDDDKNVPSTKEASNAS